jgi:hypothetical protein
MFQIRIRRAVERPVDWHSRRFISDAGSQWPDSAHKFIGLDIAPDNLSTLVFWDGLGIELTERLSLYHVSDVLSVGADAVVLAMPE